MAHKLAIEGLKLIGHLTCRLGDLALDEIEEARKNARLREEQARKEQGEAASGPSSQKKRKVYTDGATYEGELCDGLPNGEGVLKKDSYSYQGSQSHGQPHGRGVMTFEKSGWRFDGEFFAGEPIRCCVTRMGSGVVYEGEVRGFKRHGEGKVTWENNDPEDPDSGPSFYSGNWNQGVMEGRGTLTCQSGGGKGCVWECGWHNGKQEGFGTLKWTHGTMSGSVFQGVWKDGERLCGKLQYASGAVKEGQFSGGKIVQGTHRLASGAVWEGTFEEGKCVRGKHTLKSGTIWEGKFENGSCVEGKLIGTSGTIWEGKFEKGLLLPGGSMRRPDGTLFVGTFDQNKPVSGHQLRPSGEIVKISKS